MIDKTRALEELEISEEDYDDLLKAFVEIASDQLQRLGSALAGGNDTEVRELAHSLRGAAANLRLDDCLAAASAIELAWTEQHKERLRAGLDALAVALDDVRASGGA